MLCFIHNNNNIKAEKLAATAELPEIQAYTKCWYV